MHGEGKRAVMAVAMTPELREQVRAAADADRRTMSDWMRLVVEERLAELRREREGVLSG